ncbi:MAG: hypothetical protein D6819_02720, partial [Gammaproteobacteria bacterium]
MKRGLWLRSGLPLALGLALVMGVLMAAGSWAGVWARAGAATVRYVAPGACGNAIPCYHRGDVVRMTADTPKPGVGPAQGGAVLSLQSPAGPLDVGDNFTVTVRLSGLQARLSAFQFDLNYNADVVAYAGSSRGAFLGSSGRAVVCPAPIQVTTGTVRIACASTGESNGPTGSGDLMLLYFTARSEGVSSLNIGNPLLADDQRPPSTINVNTKGASVSVGARKIYLPLVMRRASTQGVRSEVTPTPFPSPTPTLL